MDSYYKETLTMKPRALIVGDLLTAYAQPSFVNPKIKSRNNVWSPVIESWSLNLRHADKPRFGEGTIPLNRLDPAALVAAWASAMED